MESLDNQIVVSIRCLTYNHAPYIRQCLDGFVMQKTNFRFEAIVHDDASTDGTQDIIREYEKKYPDIIKPIYEKENQYSKHDGSLGRIMNSAMSPSSKYIAVCEGDDFWTDPYKLQKQVDYLETHPEYTMVCNRTKLYSEKAKAYFGENYCYNNDRVVKTKDVIYRSGLFISTCSIVYRKEIQENYPQYCKQCVVGDYPLQIMAAMKGSIYYFNNTMSVYRIDNRHSWMSRQHWNSVSDYNLKRIESMINMFEGFSHDYSKYSFSFQNKIAQYLISQSPSVSQNKGKDTIYYNNYFQQYYGTFTLYWKFVDKLKNINIPKVRALSRYCLLLIFKRFSVKQVIHN